MNFFTKNTNLKQHFLEREGVGGRVSEFLSPDVSRRGCVKGPSVRQSVSQPVRPSDTILSPQLLLQFSRDFDETFQLLFP